MLKIGLIGLGGISQTVIDSLASMADDEHYKIIGALVRPGCLARPSKQTFPTCQTAEELIGFGPDVVAECASHSAVEAYGEQILAGGVKLVLISIGALADDGLYCRLKDAALQGNTSLLLPAGAIGGMDALAAAKFSGLKKVCYRARKPAMAWRGTPADTEFDLVNLTQETRIFEGTARQAALQYPKNSNVAATIALAGLGFDQTQVELLADPDASENCHEISVEANSGSFNIVLVGQTLSSNTKTSALAAYSVAKCLADLDAKVII